MSPARARTSAATRSRRSTGARARGSRPPARRDEFVVRERYAEEAPRVVVLCDRRPSMALYEPPFPWLSKPAARARGDRADRPQRRGRERRRRLPRLCGGDGSRRRAVLAAAARARSRCSGSRRGRTSSRLRRARRRARSSGLEFLGRFRSELSSGTFVFVISDFLAAVSPSAAWLTAAARRWEVVPVVVQDPIWEQSFPEFGSLVVPLARPRTGAAARGADLASARLAARQRRERDAAGRRCSASSPRSGSTRCSSTPATRSRSTVTFLDWAERRRDLRQRR